MVRQSWRICWRCRTSVDACILDRRPSGVHRRLAHLQGSSRLSHRSRQGSGPGATLLPALCCGTATTAGLLVTSMRSTSELETFWPEADWETSGGREERPFLQAPASKRDVAPRDLTVAVNGAKKISDLGLFGGAFLI